MFSLKGLLVIFALAVMTQPALALNDETPAGAPPSGPAANAPAPTAPSTTAPTQACRKVANKPKLSPEERARRREIRAQREAAGLAPPKRTAPRDGRTAQRRLPPCPTNQGL